ncbi:hypothetical protein HELRODRAFT_161027 [Helobdella robusta]|uniref:Uncharacterized protein n=1 Tax=Helobdella robusta TaxID=6412 RepID=T1ER09_HELRO|nr:hypothetical protein HELRODRAFT_161027 [Helobdella robusta]ESO01849.1 hypothetical protein HELRODRAFT_161027 [Helobdella robusta]
MTNPECSSSVGSLVFMLSGSQYNRLFLHIRQQAGSGAINIQHTTKQYNIHASMPLTKIVVSSAYDIKFNILDEAVMSLMNKLKNKGPRIGPCGMPFVADDSRRVDTLRNRFFDRNLKTKTANSVELFFRKSD